MDHFITKVPGEPFGLIDFVPYIEYFLITSFLISIFMGIHLSIHDPISNSQCTVSLHILKEA